MTAESDKELVWKKLSTVPDPGLAAILKDDISLLSKRYLLQKYLGYTKEEIDEFLDGYSSGR